MLMIEESGERQIHRARAVVYDRQSGRIVHVHEIRTLDGAPRPAAGLAARRALEVAQSIGLSVRGVVTTRLDAVETEAEGYIDIATHRVDLQTRRVTAIAGLNRRTSGK